MNRTTTTLGISALLFLWCSVAAADWTDTPRTTTVDENGVKIVLFDTDIDDEDLEAEVKMYNNSGVRLVVAAHQIAAILPGKRPYYHDDKEVVIIAPGKNKKFEIEIEADDDYEDFPGVYLRFDGIYRGGQQIRITPVKIGKPTHNPGDFRQMTMPSQAKADAGSGGGGYVPAAPSPSKSASPPPPTTTGVQGYHGARVTIKEPGTKVAAMPLRFSEVRKDVAFIMDDLLLTELQNVGFEAIGPDDINAMVGFEGMKDQMGCDDASCVAEIGNALGVPFLVAGSVAKLEGSVVLTLKLIDVRNTRVAARVSKINEGTAKVLPRVIGEAVQEMVKRSKL